MKLHKEVEAWRIFQDGPQTSFAACENVKLVPFEVFPILLQCHLFCPNVFCES